jgi:hypothetical protein
LKPGNFSLPNKLTIASVHADDRDEVLLPTARKVDDNAISPTLGHSPFPKTSKHDVQGFALPSRVLAAPLGHAAHETVGKSQVEGRPQRPQAVQGDQGGAAVGRGRGNQLTEGRTGGAQSFPAVRREFLILARSPDAHAAAAGGGAIASTHSVGGGGVDEDDDEDDDDDRPMTGYDSQFVGTPAPSDQFPVGEPKVAFRHTFSLTLRECRADVTAVVGMFSPLPCFPS